MFQKGAVSDSVDHIIYNESWGDSHKVICYIMIVVSPYSCLRDLIYTYKILSLILVMTITVSEDVSLERL